MGNPCTIISKAHILHFFSDNFSFPQFLPSISSFYSLDFSHLVTDSFFYQFIRIDLIENHVTTKKRGTKRFLIRATFLEREKQRKYWNTITKVVGGNIAPQRNRKSHVERKRTTNLKGKRDLSSTSSSLHLAWQHFASVL